MCMGARLYACLCVFVFLYEYSCVHVNMQIEIVIRYFYVPYHSKILFLYHLYSKESELILDIKIFDECHRN